MTHQEEIDVLVDHLSKGDNAYMKLLDICMRLNETINDRDKSLVSATDNYIKLSEICSQKDRIIENKDRLIKRLFVNSHHL